MTNRGGTGASGSKRLPVFQYQFLDAEKFPLGKSPEPHPWLAFKTDSLDSATTIYPRSSSAFFFQGEPCDVQVPGHPHRCSINKHGHLYLRDSLTAIQRENFVPVRPSKKGCTGETQAIQTNTLRNLAALARGSGQHIRNSDCAIGDVVSLGKNGRTMLGLVVDHWVKCKANEPVLLLALVCDFRDESIGQIEMSVQGRVANYVCPGVQFLAFKKDVKTRVATSINSEPLHEWPALFEEDRQALARKLGFSYLAATTAGKIGDKLAEKLESLGDFSKSAGRHTSTPPTLTPRAGVRVIRNHDGATAFFAQVAGTSSKNEKTDFLEALKNLPQPDDPDPTKILTGRMAQYLPMTKSYSASVGTVTLKKSKTRSSRIEFVTSTPRFLDLESYPEIITQIYDAANLEKNITYINFVDLRIQDHGVETSFWQIDERHVEVRHIEYGGQ